MDWFNYYELIAIVVVLLPNFVYAKTHAGEGVFVGLKGWTVEENIGRFWFAPYCLT